MTSIHWCEKDERPRQDSASADPEQNKVERESSTSTSVSDRHRVTAKDSGSSSLGGREESEEGEGSVGTVVEDAQIKQTAPSTDGQTDPNPAPYEADNPNEPTQTATEANTT